MYLLVLFVLVGMEKRLYIAKTQVHGLDVIPSHILSSISFCHVNLIRN